MSGAGGSGLEGGWQTGEEQSLLHTSCNRAKNTKDDSCTYCARFEDFIFITHQSEICMFINYLPNLNQMVYPSSSCCLQKLKLIKPNQTPKILDFQTYQIWAEMTNC